MGLGSTTPYMQRPTSLEPDEDSEADDMLDKWIEMHGLLWQEGGSVMTRETLFKAQEIVDDVLLEAQRRGLVRLKQNLDGRILSIVQTSPGVRIK